MPISKEKLAVIHIAKAQIGLDDDLYREILLQEANVESSKYLTDVTFDKVMKRLKGLGFRQNQKAKKQNPNALPGPWQLEKIETLYKQLGWTDLKRQQGFAQRQIKKPWPQTRADANRIIEGLKAMISRNKEGRK